MADLTAAQITIAITVYDRRRYVEEAITSAIAQTASARPTVMVVEDCGPDPEIQRFITERFGTSIIYNRNSTRRGLVGNWNACLEVCKTPWLCILHDDDFLEPGFVAAMLEVHATAPGRGLYYGACRIIDASGNPVSDSTPTTELRWREMDLGDCVRSDPVCFPGQLFRVTAAQQLGGFRSASRYCADWEMWFRIGLRYGAVETNRLVANYREHHTVGRGTTAADISGRKYAYVNMQRKRHAAWLREARGEGAFDRSALQREAPMPTRFILSHAHSFSDLMLRYNAGLLDRSAPPHLGYRLFQWLARALGWRSLGWISRLLRTRH